MPENLPDPLSQAELDSLFPLTREAPLAPNTYEIALTLGGTVSAGAYTAGVLDYIVEALDLWTRAKEDKDPQAPTHNVVLSTIAGASGGAINGAILTRLAGWEFPHGPVAGNPFYDLWVNGVDMEKLLDPKEPDTTGFSAIFNTTAFATLANNVIHATGQPLASSPATPRERSYLADPLRLFMMVANVTGIPYRIQFRGQSGLSHDLSAHADYMRFGLTVQGGIANPPGVRPDEFALLAGSGTNWDYLAATALATCAFPAAFRSRPLKRGLASLGYRVVAVPGQVPGTVEVAQLVPTWTAMNEDGKTPGDYRTVNVDGGTFNNEPLDYARKALSGLAGRNKRDGEQADRGVILIDPFSDPENPELFDPPGFFKLLGLLISAMTSQARFKPEDIALASDYDTYSRFLVAPWGPGPSGPPKAGSQVIASGGLGGFLGFLDKRFLDYDFRLGRRNAYEFLTKEFVLLAGNPLFRDWTTAQLNQFSAPDKNPVTGEVEDFLPIIPLMKALRDNFPAELTPSDWPLLRTFPPTLAGQAQARLELLFDRIKQDMNISGLTGFALDTAWSCLLRGKLRDLFVNTIRDGLIQKKLL